MELLQRYLIPLAGFATVLIAAGMLASAIEHQAQPEPSSGSNVGRYSIHETASDGWLIFDSVAGRMCSVPNVRSVNQNVNCTDAANKISSN